MELAEEEEEGSPPLESGTDMHEVDWHSRGSVPSETSRSSAFGGPDDKDGEELTGDEENDAPSTRSSASWRSALKVQSGNVETSIDDATVLLELGDHFYGPDDGFGDANSDSDHSAQGGQAWETKNVKCTVSKILEALHCGQDPTYLTPISPFDRALDLWKDHERLEKACTPLMAKNKDPHVDVLLQTCLTGMLGVLNLYLDPALQYTWREASLIIARIQGSGGEKCT